jgi:AcrR family transcriptional regulator
MVNDNEQREAIIAAATSLFARHGLEKTTMEDIAKAARKGKSSLYYYFKSKEQVYAAVIRHEIAGLKSTLAIAIAKEDNPRSAFRRFVSARLAYLGEKADQYTCIRDEYLVHYKFIETLTADYSEWEIRTIRGIVENGCDQGVFRVEDLDATARALFFALKGLEYPWAVDLAREEIEQSVTALVDVLLRGISSE